MIIGSPLGEGRASRVTGMRNLTGREFEVLVLVASGRSSKEIARQLGISFRTVEAHVERTRLKLAAANRAHMVATALAEGLVESR